MKLLSPRLIILAALLALPMLCGAAHADEVVTGSDTTESINRILRKIEEMAGVLALNDTLNADQTKAMLMDLTELHDQVKGLQHANELLLQLAAQAVRDNVGNGTSPGVPAQPEAQPQPPAQQEPPAQPPAPQEAPAEPVHQEAPAEPVQQEAPAEPVQQEAPAEPVQQEPAAGQPLPGEEGTQAPEKQYDKWEPYLDFDLKVDPQGSQYNGWVKDSNIDLRWGETGEIILEIVNGYTALWTIRNSYTGSPNVNVTTAGGGEITVQVRDDEGLHEYSIRSGGLGPIFRRWLQETAVGGDPA